MNFLGRMLNRVCRASIRRLFGSGVCCGLAALTSANLAQQPWTITNEPFESESVYPAVPGVVSARTPYVPEDRVLRARVHVPLGRLLSATDLDSLVEISRVAGTTGAGAMDPFMDDPAASADEAAEQIAPADAAGVVANALPAPAPETEPEIVPPAAAAGGAGSMSPGQIVGALSRSLWKAAPQVPGINQIPGAEKLPGLDATAPENATPETAASTPEGDAGDPFAAEPQQEGADDLFGSPDADAGATDPFNGDAADPFAESPAEDPSAGVQPEGAAEDGDPFGGEAADPFASEAKPADPFGAEMESEDPFSEP